MAAPRRSQRSTEVRSGREIATRAAFALYLVSLPGGLVALGWGAAHHSAGLLVAGGAGLILFVLLHFFARRRLGFGGLVTELKRNPFKPERPSDPDSGDDAGPRPSGGCGCGSCSGL